MLILYDKLTFKIIFIYISNAPSLDVLKEKNPGVYDNCDYISFDYDEDLLRNGSNYRLVIYDNVPIAYALKPNINLSLSKTKIVSDSADSAVLTLELSNTHYLDNITNISILLNETEVQVDIVDNIGQLEITSASEGDVGIAVKDSLFIANSILLEVI